MTMKLKVDHIFLKKKKRVKIIDYHKGKVRPAWIRLGKIPKDTRFIRLVVGDKTNRSYSYKLWNIRTNVFVPVDFSFVAAKDYYNEFSKLYDKLIEQLPKNINIGKLMLNFLKKYRKDKNIEILDLGAGTGILTELFVKEGYKNMALLDFSKGMLAKAKKKKSLKECKFIQQDIRKLKLIKKYDVIMSFFSLGLPNYFSEEETQKILKLIKTKLKKNGLLILVGFYEIPKKNPLFKTLKFGKFIPDKRRGYYFDYYIGERK